MTLLDNTQSGPGKSCFNKQDQGAKLSNGDYCIIKMEIIPNELGEFKKSINVELESNSNLPIDNASEKTITINLHSMVKKESSFEDQPDFNIDTKNQKLIYAPGQIISIPFTNGANNINNLNLDLPSFLIEQIDKTYEKNVLHYDKITPYDKKYFSFKLKENATFTEEEISEIVKNLNISANNTSNNSSLINISASNMKPTSITSEQITSQEDQPSSYVFNKRGVYLEPDSDIIRTSVLHEYPAVKKEIINLEKNSIHITNISPDIPQGVKIIDKNNCVDKYLDENETCSFDIQEENYVNPDSVNHYIDNINAQYTQNNLTNSLYQESVVTASVDVYTQTALHITSDYEPFFNKPATGSIATKFKVENIGNFTWYPPTEPTILPSFYHIKGDGVSLDINSTIENNCLDIQSIPINGFCYVPIKIDSTAVNSNENYIVLTKTSDQSNIQSDSNPYNFSIAGSKATLNWSWKGYSSENDPQQLSLNQLEDGKNVGISKPQYFQISNIGDSDITNMQLQIDNSNIHDFILKSVSSEECSGILTTGSTLKGKQSCTFSIENKNGNIPKSDMVHLVIKADNEADIENFKDYSELAIYSLKTISCPNMSPGDLYEGWTGNNYLVLDDGNDVNGIDNQNIINMIIEGKNVCTTHVTNIDNLFKDKKELNNDNLKALDYWDTSNVTSMYGTFANSNFNTSLANWNTSKLTNFAYTFANSTFNQNINNWDTSKVTTLRSLFVGNKSYNQPINKWNVANVTSIFQLFRNTTFNQPLNDWKLSNLQDADWSFADDRQFNQNLSNWKSILSSNVSHDNYDANTSSDWKSTDKPFSLAGRSKN